MYTLINTLSTWETPFISASWITTLCCDLVLWTSRVVRRWRIWICHLARVFVVHQEWGCAVAYPFIIGVVCWKRGCVLFSLNLLQYVNHLVFIKRQWTRTKVSLQLSEERLKPKRLALEERDNMMDLFVSICRDLLHAGCDGVGHGVLYRLRCM